MMGEMCSSVHVDFFRMDNPDGVKIRDALTLCLQILGDGQDDTMGDSLLGIHYVLRVCVAPIVKLGKFIVMFTFVKRGEIKNFFHFVLFTR